MRAVEQIERCSPDGIDDRRVGDLAAAASFLESPSLQHFMPHSDDIFPACYLSSV